MAATGGILRQYAKNVFFSVMGMLGLSLYIFADTFFVANGIGAEGLAALNLAIPVFSFVNGLGLMVGMGGGTLYAGRAARGDKRGARAAFEGAVTLALALGAALLALGAFFAEGIGAALGADRVLMPLAAPYIRTILMFAPAFLLSNTLVCFARNDGAQKRGMAAMLTGSFSNIVLDYLCIYPLGMSMFGAALATGLGAVLSCGVALPRFWARLKGLRPALPGPGVLGGIFSLGGQAFVGEFANGTVMLAFNFTILSIAGNIGVAAYGVIANIALIAVSVFSGVAQGAQPQITRAHALGNTAELRTLLRYGIVTAALLGAAFLGCGLAFPGPITGIFGGNQNQELRLLAGAGIPLYFMAFPAAGAGVVIASGLAASGMPARALLIALLRSALLPLPLIMVLPRVLGMTGVWMVVPIAEGISLGAAAIALGRPPAAAGGGGRKAACQ